MSRRVTIDTDSIIKAARDVFLKHGMAAKTSDVAKRAGVSEGSIFVRFKSKEDLFRAAMSAQLEEDGWLEPLALATRPGSAQDKLFAIGAAGLVYFRKVLPLSMMAWSNPGKDGLPRRAKSKTEPTPLLHRRRLAEFLSAEIAAGRVRDCDVATVAQVLVSACVHYVMTELTIIRKKQTKEEDLAYVRNVVDLLWDGLSPR